MMALPFCRALYEDPKFNECMYQLPTQLLTLESGSEGTGIPRVFSSISGSAVCLYLLFVSFLCQVFNIGKAEDSDPIPHCTVTRKCPSLKTNIKDPRSYKTRTPIPVHPSGKDSGEKGLKTKVNFTTQIGNICVVPCLC